VGPGRSGGRATGTFAETASPQLDALMFTRVHILMFTRVREGATSQFRCAAVSGRSGSSTRPAIPSLLTASLARLFLAVLRGAGDADARARAFPLTHRSVLPVGRRASCLFLGCPSGYGLGLCGVSAIQLTRYRHADAQMRATVDVVRFVANVVERNVAAPDDVLTLNSHQLSGMLQIELRPVTM